MWRGHGSPTRYPSHPARWPSPVSQPLRHVVECESRVAATAGHDLRRVTRPASYGLPLPGAVRVKPDADQEPIERERGAGRDPGLCEITEGHARNGKAGVACNASILADQPAVNVAPGTRILTLGAYQLLTAAYRDCKQRCRDAIHYGSH